MKPERFEYISFPAPWGKGRVWVRGHSEWVQLLFHPNEVLHDNAWFMVELDAKYNRRYRPAAWKLWKMPERPWDMVFEDPPAPPRAGERVLGWALALYALRRSL
jgi:hypothetical protein